MTNAAVAPPYDALLLVSFGGPEGPDDVVPFLQNVTRGRDIPVERLQIVGEHYYHFGGVSPINEQNRRLLAAIREEFAAHDIALPVYWGNRNWDPYLAGAVRAMADDGVRRALAFFTSAYSSYSGCRQYRENLFAAVVDRDVDLEIDRIGPYYNHPGFIEPFVDATCTALGRLRDRLSADDRSQVELVFTTHSLPVAMASSSGPRDNSYVTQHQFVATAIADAVAAVTGERWPSRLVFQSRSGPPGQPWLEPDVGDHLVQLRIDGRAGAVLIPIGFVSDHMEVLWDLDTQAQQRADEVGLLIERAGTPSTDQRFVSMVRELVVERVTGQPVEERRRWPGSIAAPNACVIGCCANPRGDIPAIGGDSRRATK